MGIGIITGSLVGRAIGGNNVELAKTKAKVSISLSFIFGLIFIAVFVVFEKDIAGIYMKDDHTLNVLHGVWLMFMFQRVIGSVFGAFQGVITGLGL